MNVGKKARIAELELDNILMSGAVGSLRRECSDLGRKVDALDEARIRAQANREAMRKERKEGAVTAGVGVKPGIYYWDSGATPKPAELTVTVAGGSISIDSTMLSVRMGVVGRFGSIPLVEMTPDEARAIGEAMILNADAFNIRDEKHG